MATVPTLVGIHLYVSNGLEVHIANPPPLLLDGPAPAQRKGTDAPADGSFSFSGEQVYEMGSAPSNFSEAGLAAAAKADAERAQGLC